MELVKVFQYVGMQNLAEKDKRNTRSLMQTTKSWCLLGLSLAFSYFPKHNYGLCAFSMAQQRFKPVNLKSEFDKT